MVKVIVDKNALTKMVEVGIRFTIVEDKPKRETPKEWQDYLIQLHERWNKQKKIAGRKGLPKNRSIVKTHKEAWDKLYWNFYNAKSEDPVKEVLKLVKQGLSNYIRDIKDRKGEDRYVDHRFKLYPFLSQKNGLKKFISE